MMSPQVLELTGRINTLDLAPATGFQNSRSDERLAAPVNAVFSSHYAFLHQVWMQHRDSNLGNLGSPHETEKSNASASAALT